MANTINRRTIALGLGVFYTAIGALDRDSDGIWRTTAMKGDNMMSVAVNENGEIEDR